MKTQIGLDLFEKKWPASLKGATVGLLCHPASIDGALAHAADRFLAFKKARVGAFFGPQHGIRGETQANMIEWEGGTDEATGLPVYSLYGEHRKPTPKMLAPLDAIVLDLFDVGSRYYTYIWTLYLVMEACFEQNKALVVLDRPNPINGVTLEGPLLDQSHASFVGLKPMVIRHGMTTGEVAQLFVNRYFPTLKLHVIALQGWKRDQYYDTTGHAWVLPSPNMPTLDTALVYPGMCLLEGVNVSEGRGTTRPFELFGAPWLDAEPLVKRLNDFALPGVHFRPYHFLPTFDKYKGELCHGAFIHVTDRKKFKPFLSALAILKASREAAPKSFKWLKGPYEYERKKLPIDILLGNNRLRPLLEEGAALKNLEASYAHETAAFKKERAATLLY